MTVYTATLRDYVIGCDADWDWEVVPAGGPDGYRTDYVDLAGRDGATAGGADLLAAGEWSFELVHESGVRADVETVERELVAAWAPVTLGTVDLTLSLASGDFVIIGRPGRPVFDRRGYEFGFGRALAPFVQLDPLWYSASYSSVLLTLTAASGGFTTPLTTPLTTTGSSGGGDAFASSAGSAPSHWTATITATTALTDPRLALNGETIVEVAGTVAVGQVLIVDSRNRTLTLDGTLRNWATLGSPWTQIPPGGSTISLRASSGTGTCVVQWRDANY